MSSHKRLIMKPAHTLAAIAFAFAASPLATAIDAPLARPAAGVAAAQEAGAEVGMWDGRWEGTTVSGQPLVLEVRVKGERMTGRLRVGKQSADITAGKALDKAFALTTKPIDGHSVSATGRQVGDAIELTIEGVKEPLTLTRVR
jgi:hypothetical protein